MDPNHQYSMVETDDDKFVTQAYDIANNSNRKIQRKFKQQKQRYPYIPRSDRQR